MRHGFDFGAKNAVQVKPGAKFRLHRRKYILVTVLSVDGVRVQYKTGKGEVRSAEIYNFIQAYSPA